jgi:hypothetical protein
VGWQSPQLTKSCINNNQRELDKSVGPMVCLKDHDFERISFQRPNVPFDIGVIDKIFSFDPDIVNIRVRKLYRPEEVAFFSKDFVSMLEHFFFSFH